MTIHSGQVRYCDVSLRLFNVYGRRDSADYGYANVTCKFAYAAARGMGVTLFADGDQSREVVYVSELVDAMVTVAWRDARYDAYHVGTGVEIGPLLRRCEERGGTPIPADRKSPWPHDILAIRADVNRLRDDLKLSATVGLNEGLERTIAACRDESE